MLGGLLRLGLDQELALGSPHADEWRKVLARCQLDPIKALAISLAAETVNLDQDPTNTNEIAAPLRSWLTKLAAQAAALDARHREARSARRLRLVRRAAHSRG